MRYATNYSSALGEVRIDLVSNCYTDSFPLLRRLLFRKLPIDLKSSSTALAVAILTGDYCGELFDFGSVKLASDYAEAVRQLLGDGVNVMNVDGMARTLSGGEIDVVVQRAGEPFHELPTSGRVPVARVDWSGDFVALETRSSAGFTFGKVQTNAAFFADPFRVSVDVGLLFAPDRCRRLLVQAPANAADAKAVRAALSIVGISLEAFE